MPQIRLPVRSRLASAVLAAVLCGLATLVQAQSPTAQSAGFGAGLIDLALVDPVEGGPMAATVIYPTQGRGSVTQRPPFTVDATADATPASGPFALIVLSHGTGGGMLGHHDSLTALARAGFVAAAVEHPRDNYRDGSGFATDLQLVGRPHHIVALIDGLLKHPTVGPLIDARRIGMAGHSAGGYTGLLIAGAVPDFSLAAEYRRAVPNDPLRKRADAAPRERQKPDLAYVSDPRVRSLFLMAPALGYVFDKAALAKVQVPVRIYRPSADEILAHPWNAERFAELLPVRPEYQVVERAGHFVFLAPCPTLLATRVPFICKDPKGIDRVAFHATLNAEMIEFFRRTLPPQ
jgi:predicted dienelactone hydrolase